MNRLTLPLQDVNWDDLDEIMRHLPVTERNRALQMQEVALFDVVVFKEYLKTHHIQFVSQSARHVLGLPSVVDTE